MAWQNKQGRPGKGGKEGRMIQKMEKVRKMEGMLKKKVHAYLSQQPNKAKSTWGGGEFSSF